MLVQHLGKGITEAQRRRWMDLLVDAADEVGSAGRPRVPRRLRVLPRVGHTSRSRQLSTRRRAAAAGAGTALGLGRRPALPTEGNKHMTALEELADLVRKAATDAGPSVVSIGRAGRGSGFVVAPGASSPTPTTCATARPPCASPTAEPCKEQSTGSDIDGDLVVLDVDTADAPALSWSEGQSARATSSSPSPRVASAYGPRGARSPAPTVGSAVRAAGASPVRSSTPPRRRRVLGSAPCSIAPARSSASTRTASTMASTSPGAADADLRDQVTAMAEGRRYERARLGVALAPPARGRQAAPLRRAARPRRAARAWRRRRLPRRRRRDHRG